MNLINPRALQSSIDFMWAITQSKQIEHIYSFKKGHVCQTYILFPALWMHVLKHPLWEPKCAEKKVDIDQVRPISNSFCIKKANLELEWN